MTTSIQDRAKMIATSVEDMAVRQISDAIVADPVRAHLSAFFTQAVDGVFLKHPHSEETVLIHREEFANMQTEDLFKLVADKRAGMMGEDDA